MNVLVCVKRVPDTSGEVLLSADAREVDARYVGYTMSAHEECAVELATEVAAATGGTATVLSLGSADAVDQLRAALAVGCTAAVLIEADSSAFGPTDVAREIAAVVRDHETAGTPYDLVLLGNDAADTGDHQVGIRVAHALGRPVVNGVTEIEADGDGLVARGEGPDGRETYRVPTPAVATVLEGGVDPRYPTITGRMRAKKVQVEMRVPAADPVGSGKVRLLLPPAQPSSVVVLGEGKDAAGAVVDVLEKLGVAR